MLGTHPVPDSGCESGSARTTPPTAPSRLRKPELLATGPNQVWTWDITRLKGPRKWTSFSLYVILDIFSRQVVGWMVADCESATLAKKLIGESCDRQRIDRGQLILHADRGSSMKSKAVALLLSDLGVTQSHSRPQVSDDNPFSEAQFKTLKYRPTSRTIRFHPGRQGLLSGLFPLVQPCPLPFGPELAHSGDGPLRSDRPGSPTTSAGSGSRSPTTPGAFRQRTQADRRTAGQGVDQSACRGKESSLISGTQLSQIY